MTNTVYMVQYNLAGLTGPLEMFFDPDFSEEEDHSYWDESGNFSTDGSDTISYNFSKKHFDTFEDAQSFVKGIRWFMEVQAKRYLPNINWI